MRKKTKILATVGPASDSLEVLEGLIKAGVNVFRLNFSHGTHEYHSQTIAKIREASKNVNIKVGVLQDICGPKVRVGKLESDFHLKKGDKVVFTKEKIEGTKLDEGNYRVCINQPNILDMIKQDEYSYKH
jgi:pyruvate kinase